ncbi:hypothetical protein FXO37_18300 [Capsicum annuum]|nr:hypothetical protein FXO37_18300 [Capsicum annuum]
MVKLINKELDGAIDIRRAVRQGQPNIEAFHDQPTATNLGASSRGVAGVVVDVGGRHADATSKLIDNFPVKAFMKQPWDFEGLNKDMDLLKNKTSVAYESDMFTHIKCLLTGTEMAEPMNFLCDNAMANMQEVYTYGVLTRFLEPVYKKEPMK